MQLKIEIDKKSIGRRLKTARESFGLTQEKLSEEMGCTSKYISKVENGASAPSLPFVIKFSEITGSDLNYLLRGMYPKGESTVMLVREPASIYELSAGLSKKSRKICSEVMTKIIEVLEENKI